MDDLEKTQNSGKVVPRDVLLDENGRFKKGHPKVGGRVEGTTNKISVIGTIERMFQDDPEMFLNFVDKYLKDPRNRQHIVEMIDGKPQGNQTNVAVGVNITNNITDQDRDDYAIDRVRMLIKQGKINREEI